jgi:subtilisin-like proprotein convertase family protein
MKTLRLALCVMAAYAAAAWSAAQVPTLSGPAPARLAPPPPSVPSSVTLYDQTDSPGAQASSSQDFEAAFDGFDDQGADDFVVPAGVNWSITGVHVAGVYFNGAGPAPTVHVHFYADAAGLPGGSVCDYLDVTPTDTTGTFDIALPSPCVLGGGTYWVSVIAHMDFGAGGQWGWTDRTVQSNSPSAWQNPGGGFGVCPAWAAKTGCVIGSAVDFAFSLSGTAGGSVPPSPAECGETTSYFENMTPVPIPDEPGPVASSTISVTGMSGGIWDVNAITYITHTFPGDLDMTIQSPAGTIVTLSTDNGGSADNAFNGTVWDDQADSGSQVPYAVSPNLVNDHTYTTGVLASPLAPEEALNAFRGENPNGTWTITIDDDSGADTGTLNGWALQITTLSGGITVTATASFANSTAIPIPDSGGGAVTSTVDASAHPGSFVCRIRVTTDISHTFPGDLDMTLMSPSGRIATISTDNGGSADNAFAGTLWTDFANPGGQVPYATNDGLVNDTAYSVGVPAATLVPEEAFALFVGDDPRGVWTLTINDDAGGDTGTLNSWGLEVTTCTCASAQKDAPLRVDEHASSGSSNLNHVFEVGETVRVEPSWLNPGSTPFSVIAIAGSFGGPAGPTYNTVDSTANYGTFAPGQTKNCFDATGDCYDLSITAASRPAQHWDATFHESIFEISRPQEPGSPEAFADWTLHIGESFGDVPTGNLFYPFIENIFHNGITGGCGGTGYCPGNFTLRKQMAVFVLKSKEGSSYVPPPAVGIFTDVPMADPFAPWIEELYNRSVVAGCGAGPTYCPDNPVLRQQMAVFLLKTLLGSGYTPPAATGLFGDVPLSNPFAAWIEDLSNRGIAAGCGGGNFCPANSTTRGQMAPFLVKTFGLLLYGP